MGCGSDGCGSCGCGTGTETAEVNEKEYLENYLEELNKETQAVTERLNELKKQGEVKK